MATLCWIWSSALLWPRGGRPWGSVRWSQYPKFKFSYSHLRPRFPYKYHEVFSLAGLPFLLGLFGIHPLASKLGLLRTLDVLLLFARRHHHSAVNLSVVVVRADGRPARAPQVPGMAAAGTLKKFSPSRSLASASSFSSPSLRKRKQPAPQLSSASTTPPVAVLVVRTRRAGVVPRRRNLNSRTYTSTCQRP